HVYSVPVAVEHLDDDVQILPDEQAPGAADVLILRHSYSISPVNGRDAMYSPTRGIDASYSASKGSIDTYSPTSSIWSAGCSSTGVNPNSVRSPMLLGVPMPRVMRPDAITTSS